MFTNKSLNIAFLVISAMVVVAAGIYVYSQNNDQHIPPPITPVRTDSVILPSPKPTPTKKGIVKGVVLLGPTCPVERIPPDPRCADKPYQTAIRIQTNDSSGNPSTLFSTIESDASGRFSISLPAGSYTLRPAGGNQMPPTCRPQNITVIAGETQAITLSCDTGIR